MIREKIIKSLESKKNKLHYRLRYYKLPNKEVLPLLAEYEETCKEIEIQKAYLSHEGEVNVVQ